MAVQSSLLTGGAAAPNSLFASLRWHLCRGCNQPARGCLVNDTLSKKPNAMSLVTDFIGMRCKLVTYGPRVAAVLLALGVGGCAWTGGSDGLSYTSDRGVENQTYPANYRSELLALLRTYLNDPTGVREAGISEPAQRKSEGGGVMWSACASTRAAGPGDIPA
jgi:hypothetical protein